MVGDIFSLAMLLISSAIFLALALANELGYRAGRFSSGVESESSRAVANAIKGSIIGLVAFLLGFAFSISFGRHDQRRKVVLDEANAAGTLYLRAGLLDQPQGQQVRAIVQSFVDERLRYFELGPDHISAPESLAKINDLLDQIWNAVEKAKDQDSQAVLVSQVVTAANALIDLNTTRSWTLRGRTPDAVLIVLSVSVLIAATLIGHSFGENQRRHIWLCLSFNVLLTLILQVILDFDGPRYGLIQVDHTPFQELRESLQRFP